jgi:hypothetical protein
MIEHDSLAFHNVAVLVPAPAGALLLVRILEQYLELSGIPFVRQCDPLVGCLRNSIRFRQTEYVALSMLLPWATTSCL